MFFQFAASCNYKSRHACQGIKLPFWSKCFHWFGVFTLLAISGYSQVINFDVPGGVSGAANYAGQGAYSDAGHDYWNLVVGGGTAVSNKLSDGITPTPVTLTSQMGGAYGTQGAQGTPAALQQPYHYNSGVRRTNTLSYVPAGTYNLYLYGINNTGTRGTTFTVSTSAMSPITQVTSNTPASLNNFILGADYVVFSNVVLTVPGAITITWAANTNVTVTGNNEGDFNALQLVTVSTNATALNPNFGNNVLVFDPAMSMSAIQSQVDNIFSAQKNSEFGSGRYAFFFKPGHYTNLAVNIGYYTQVLGLGQQPDDVLITGNVRSDGALANNNATTTFWRCCENFAFTPTATTTSPLEANSTMTFAASQGASLRRLHVKGNLNLANTNSQAWSSGGLLSDSKIDGVVNSKTQQQWLSRNDQWTSWVGQNWNMVFVGVSNPPTGVWPGTKYTVITNTPLIREKPYLALGGDGKYVVIVPDMRTNSVGTTWANGATSASSISIDQFYLAQPGLDNAETINSALNTGANLILTPGIYNLTNTLVVTRSNTIIMGLGYPTLIPTNRNPILSVSDVDGVKISGLILDAGKTAALSLLTIGATTNSLRHQANPVCLFDVVCRVGGEFAGTTTNCITINANDVLAENLWLWRADHGSGASPLWTGNPSSSGLVVNGDYVTIYGLLNEHHQKFQTLWNGNWGRVYFYQSELPYDAPSQAVWSHDGVNGYASYKISDQVISHQAYGLGIYGVFNNSTDACYNVIETPVNAPQVNVHHMIMVYITGQAGSEMTHIINGQGNTLTTGVTTATANQIWTNPPFSLSPSTTDGSNVNVVMPTESWHSYQLQFKNQLTDALWSNLGDTIVGNDSLQAFSITNSSSLRFYRVKAN
jgi:hypothetical protein